MLFFVRYFVGSFVCLFQMQYSKSISNKRATTSKPLVHTTHEQRRKSD